MSQYVQQNSQRFYSTASQYTAGQTNYFPQQFQRNPIIRESFLNRNNSIGSMMTLKSGKIQESFAGKIKRDSNMKNSADFKENDPYIKNSIFTGHINKVNGNLRDSMEMVSQYENKNSYCNPLIMKREKNSHEMSRQKLIPNQCANKDHLSQNTGKNIENKSKQGVSQPQYDSLSQRVTKLESLMKDNAVILSLHSSKLQKLQGFSHNTLPQHQIRNNNDVRSSQQSSSSLTKTRHSRSITSNMTATPSFKELSDIMSLIEESKNYQIKNAQQYRKMIEEFRSTLLEFREELNKTVKKTDIQAEMLKLKEMASGNVNANNSVNSSSNNGAFSLSRKSSNKQIQSTNTNTNSTLSNMKPICQSSTFQKIQSQINSLKLAIQRLQENDMSLKADLIKSNVRQKKFCQQVGTSLVEVNKKIVTLSKEILPFNNIDMKRGNRYQGTPICFRVSQQLISCPIPKPPVLSKSTHIPFSSSPQHNKESSPTMSSLRNSHDNTSSSIGTNSTSSSSQMLTVNTKTYYIDKDGCLLDKEGYYLLNERNQQIKLSQKEISMLRKLKVLQ